MTLETTTSLSPTAVLEAARECCLGEGRLFDAWVEDESETHLGIGTFRGKLVVAAFPDPKGEAPTRVRISTLRDEGMASRLLSYLRTLESASPARA